MIFCFGLAWPVSVYKSYVSRSTKGKSVFFLFIVLFGYVAGMIHVVIDYDGFSYLNVLYGVNAAMIITDVLLYFRNRRIERLAGEE